MHANMTNDINAVESLMEASASIIGKLNSMIHADTPTKPMALESDCCGSNNYPEEPQQQG
jgi:hypothetical protein